MKDILQRRITPSNGAVESPVGDETVILHLKDGVYYGLDPVGTRIWALLKEGLTPLEICERLSAEYDVALDVIEADARQFLSDLEAHEIVVDV